MLFTEVYPSLSLCDIDEKYRLIINPDNLFFCLVSKNKDLDSTLKKEILPLYEEHKNKFDREMHRFRFESDLKAFYINPVDRCNADCVYCYIPSEVRKSGSKMDRKAFRNVLEKIYGYFHNSGKNAFLKPVIIFHGSEPLLVKDILFESISDFSDRFLFGIQTNALLLSEQDVKFLKEQKVNVGLSLDSPYPDTNDLIRKTSSGQGSTYDKVIRAIDWFDGYTGLNVISTITKYNVAQLPELIRFLHERKVVCVLLNPVRATKESVQFLRAEPGTLLKYFIEAINKTIELSLEKKNNIIIGNFANLILGIIAPQGRRLMCDITPCGGGRCFLAITAQGDFIPCGEFLGMEEFHAGNIFTNTIEEAINSSAFRAVRSRIVERIDECKNCIYRNICGAPCPAEVYALSGDMCVASPYCEFYKELIRYAFKLIAEDKVKYLLREEAYKNLEYEYRLIEPQIIA